MWKTKISIQVVGASKGARLGLEKVGGSLELVEIKQAQNAATPNEGANLSD